MTEDFEHEKLKKLTINKLFKRFDHTLHFGNEDEIAILTAPNGYGKTILLKIIDSFFNNRLHFFIKLKFEKIKIEFVSGKSIVIYKDREIDLFGIDETQEKDTLFIEAAGFGEGNEAVKRELAPLKDAANLLHIEREAPVDRLSENVWYDYLVERKLTTDEIIQKYSDQINPKFLKKHELPNAIGNALKAIKTHFVETQRLLFLEDRERISPSKRGFHSKPTSVVEKDSKDLARKIDQVVKEYATKAQHLDETFPKRVIESPKDNIASQETIRFQLQELSKKRDSLVSVGLINSTFSEPISPTDDFDDNSLRRMLSIYIEDTNEKLSIFDEIFEKISLFKETLDSYFSFKKVITDSINGIRVIDIETNHEIPLTELSSGEQHELVLIYELLFKVDEGAVILIDEPELSLHVAWQKRFISDIQKIQKLKNLDVVIATHSPQIINNNWHLVQELEE